MDANKYRDIFNTLVSQSAESTRKFHLNWENRQEILDEDKPFTGFDRHYIYHVAWAMRTLGKIKPRLHHDFSSSLFFSVSASSILPIVFCDIRPANIQLDNLQTKFSDLTKLDFSSNSLESVSCMHVVEHIGLGRYGDTVDFDGDIKAINELKRVVRPGGDLLFVVPVGKESYVKYNAHRVYEYYSVIKMFDAEFDVLEHALIPEHSQLGIVYSPATQLIATQSYGCGCFWFRKRWV